MLTREEIEEWPDFPQDEGSVENLHSGNGCAQDSPRSGSDPSRRTTLAAALTDHSFRMMDDLVVLLRACERWRRP
jgi:hypothetical protein